MKKNLSKYYPIKMMPACKEYIWGGDRLIKEWGKSCEYNILAECWELSTHKNGQSVATNGVLKGKTLSEIIENYGNKCLGIHVRNTNHFPILIKFIDSEQKLSIQVHPDDSYALANDGEYGKTEMWYIVEAKENSGVLCGFRNNLTTIQFAESINNNTLIDQLNWIPVKKGDVFFISPGTVHAICEGTIIVEIQQNSDVTYRVYDYNRKNADGKTRPLHIKKAIDVSSLWKENYNGMPQGSTIQISGTIKTLLIECKYFIVNEYKIVKSLDLMVSDLSFQSLVFIAGNGEIRWENKRIEFNRGDTFFLPAGMGTFTIYGKTTVLVTEV